MADKVFITGWQWIQIQDLTGCSDEYMEARFQLYKNSFEDN